MTPSTRAHSPRWSRSAGTTSLYFPEHTHIPASRETQYPGGGELPRKYAHTYDLFVAMTAAAWRRAACASAAASA